MRQKLVAVILILAAAACAGMAVATYQDDRAKAEARAERIAEQERAEVWAKHLQKLEVQARLDEPYSRAGLHRMDPAYY